MYDLLNQVNRTLEPQVTGLLKARFGLSERQALYALPIVTSLLFVEIKRCLGHPERHPDVLARLESLLHEQVDKAALHPAPVAPLTRLGRDLLGQRRAVVARTLNAVAGVPTPTSEALTDFLLPHILSALAGKSYVLREVARLALRQPQEHKDRLGLLRLLLTTNTVAHALSSTHAQLFY